MKTYIPRRNFTIKSLCYILVIYILIVLCYIISSKNFKSTYSNMVDGEKDSEDFEFERMLLKFKEDELVHGSMARLKYILQWTSPDTIPFVYMSKGQQGFVDRNCTFQNCFVTNNRSLFKDYTRYDVIAFHGPEVIFMNEHSLPDRRSRQQKYVFGSMESSDYYPVCSSRFDNFFNWTWTYRLDPYPKWGYFTVRDIDNNIIGPKDVMHWMNLSEMKPVSEEFKNKLKTKTKAAAWFVSNCESRSGREKFVEELQKELRKYQLGVDIYGGCGTFECSRDSESACDKVVEDHYYFYLSFENSFAEDYVTEKLLRALQHNAVPIVYGAANYTRFMPDGIYLNARELGGEKLASEMYTIISNPDRYADFFRWKNHYSYHDSADYPDSDFYCGFCAMLNNEEYMKTTSIIKDFRQWWDPPGRC